MLRFRIVTSYWLIFILGLPLWWSTTSIQRLTLPVNRVISTANKPEPHFPLDISIEPAIGESSTKYTDPKSLARQVENLLNDEKTNDPISWLGLTINVIGISHAKREGLTYSVKIHSNPSSPDKEDNEQPSLWLDTRSLHVRDKSSSSDLSSLTASLVNALSGLLVPHATTHRAGNPQRLIARYASNFRLSFSLLNEDASAGDAVLGWDLEAAIDNYIYPVLSQLEVLHNFTIESQVQFHAPLAFDPPKSISSVNECHYLLREEDLKIFVNSADWTLASSVSNDPVLHFILFVPSASRRPLVVQTPAGKRSDSFVVPQWGSIVILDPSTLNKKDEYLQEGGIHLSTTDLAGPFNAFRSQLLTLLGVPSLPPSISYPQPSSALNKSNLLSEWQLDALLRKRALENTRDSKEALSSIVKLVDQIENMPVGQDVKGDVHGALDAIDQVYSTAFDSPQWALQHSARANALSSRAFFNPGMLALLYFPAEHKYAVYIPLFAPVSVPLVVAVLREIKRWRQKQVLRRQKQD
ncbi:hypothetical protein K439DRAFT_1611324 [Ramaria rubella]|nr:hypothetical protein K439DRAFT_1611324 [Ramaria rubella]